jgi:hypothetical protein
VVTFIGGTMLVKRGEKKLILGYVKASRTRFNLERKWLRIQNQTKRFIKKILELKLEVLFLN